MTFKREGSGAVQAGTRYRQKVLLPLAPSWDVEVTSITQDSITRKFLNGMFTGEETVNLHPKAQGLEVQYLMHYQINGVLNNVLWKLMFERLHNSNIEAILQNLKKDLERQR